MVDLVSHVKDCAWVDGELLLKINLVNWSQTYIFQLRTSIWVLTVFLTMFNILTAY